MSFISESNSIGKKLHVQGLRAPVLAGLFIVAAVLLVIFGQTVWGIIAGNIDGGSGIDIEASQTSSEGAKTNQFVDDSTEQNSSSGDEDSEFSTQSKTIFVDVVGQVKKPGLYELTEGSRLATAIEMAGGFTKKADSSSVNQAQVLTDGEQIIVSAKSEDSEDSSSNSSSSSSGASSSSSASSGKSSTSNSKININSASAEELTALSGVGEVTAAKIVADREANGPFKKPEDIKRVSGIGDKRYEAIADFIRV